MANDSQGEPTKRSGLGTSGPSSVEAPAHSPPSKRRKTVWWHMLRILLVCTLLIALLALIGLLSQTIASAVDASRYPPPGKLIDVGGYRLHLYCTGTSHLGSPTVILEAGGGGLSQEWSKVQPSVASFTRVCSYDRAGYGWSDNGPLPRTVGRLVTELHTLLARAAVPGPYILVGHSFGGLIARLYAYSYPQKVAGLVLVDSISEEMNRYPSELANEATVVNLVSICQALGPFGIVRLLGYLDNYGAEFPPTTQPVAQAHLFQTRECVTAHDELVAWNESLAQVGAARYPFGHLPLVVLTRGVEGDYFQGNAGKPVSAAWLTLQKDLVSLSINSQQIIATRSGHNIPLDQPDLVIAAIKQVLTGKV